MGVSSFNAGGQPGGHCKLLFMSSRQLPRRALLLLISMLAFLAPAAAEIPIPPDISPEAQEFYRQLPPRRAGASNLSDPAVLVRLRTGLGKMFLGNARRVRTDYTLEAVDAGGAPAMGTNAEPVERKSALTSWRRLISLRQTDLSRRADRAAAGLAVLSVDSSPPSIGIRRHRRGAKSRILAAKNGSGRGTSECSGTRPAARSRLTSCWGGEAGLKIRRRWR